MKKIDRRVNKYGKHEIEQSVEAYQKIEKPVNAASFNSLMNEESYALVSGYYRLFRREPLMGEPKYHVIHNPKRTDEGLREMQEDSEEMIAFAKASGFPGHQHMGKIMTPKAQEKVFQGWFAELKPEFLGDTGKKGQKNWWDAKRNFDFLVPKEYRWTKAPRLSVKGVTINGTKKPLKRACLMTICQTNQNYVIIDLDMRSAHSYIAAKLAGPDSVIQSLLNNNIWKNKVEEIKGDFPESISFKQLKAALKIGVYGTLNGGNPVGPQILDDNIMEGVFGKSVDQQIIKEKIITVFENWDLIASIKDLSNQVSVKYGLLNELHGIDRLKPYALEEKHKLISRYLQGYEVVLLSVIAYNILYSGGLVLSLEHDGVVCLFEKKSSAQLSPEDVMVEVTEKVSAGLKPWAKLLLKQEIPLETKLLITHDRIREF